MKPQQLIPLLFLAAASSVVAQSTPAPTAPLLPAAWQADWAKPPVSCRPLQIVHGIKPERATLEGMAFYKNHGLGGIVCNVDFKQYMVSESYWKTFVEGVDSCSKLGLRVWIYDEEGYPSGSAGGLVLKENPEFEASELVFDPAAADPLVVRRAYEFTHACNNYHVARRYLNLIDDRGVRCFIQKTHAAYWRRIESLFAKTVEAFFTDEPSLIAINLGQIPEKVRAKVRVADPQDPSVKSLPAIPWAYDLPDRYRERWKEDLLSKRKSLFEGDAPEDRKVREQFWGLISELMASRYFGQLQTWCQAHQVVSSGHSLSEEDILRQVPLYGNSLKSLGRMDLPGLDMLTSNPEAVIHSGWLTAALPLSASVLNGHRRVMTEISDFSEKMGGHGPASLELMQSAAAWQAAWGVTEFTLYYQPEDRPVEAYCAYGDYVGRINAVLREAKPVPQVALYYPVHDLWSEYKPVAEVLSLKTQSPRAQKIVSSFNRLGQTLQKSQLPFLLVDHELLAGAKLLPDGRLSIRDVAFEAIVLPEEVELPAAAAAVVEQFKKAGGRVGVDRVDARLTAAAMADGLKPVGRLTPATPQVAVGHFLRDGHRILLVANVGSQAYTGTLNAGAAGTWLTLDPATGSVAAATQDESGQIRLQLAPHQAVLLVGNEPGR